MVNISLKTISNQSIMITSRILNPSLTETRLLKPRFVKSLSFLSSRTILEYLSMPFMVLAPVLAPIFSPAMTRQRLC